MHKPFEDWCEAWIPLAVNAWYREQCRDVYAAFYLYFKRGTADGPGALVIAQDAPNEDWELGTGERISPAWTPEYVRQWCRTVCGRLPILKAG